MDRRVLLFTTLGRPNQESERFITASFSSWKKYGFDVMVFGDSDILDITKKWGFNLNLNAEKNEFGFHNPFLDWNVLIISSICRTIPNSHLVKPPGYNGVVTSLNRTPRVG